MNRFWHWKWAFHVIACMYLILAVAAEGLPRYAFAIAAIFFALMAFDRVEGGPR
jgi:hypothetical protein